MAKIGKFWLLFVFAVTGLNLTRALASEGVSVTASVDRESMEEGDTFTLLISVSSKGSVTVEEPRLPSFKNLDLINSWSSSETSSTYANGQFEVQQSRIFNYMLAPNAAGKQRIDPVEVVVNGSSYKTKALDIEVKKAGSVPTRPKAQRPQGQPVDPLDDADELFSQLLRRRMPGFKSQPINPDESFFIQVDVDKTKVYEGQQVTASWYLYTRSLIRDIDTLKYPALNGFWKEEIDLATRLEWQDEVINGLVYKKALLVSYALFPIKQGKAVIDPYKAKCSVMADSAFGFGRQYVYTKASKPVEVQVTPVPSEGRPADYTGAVGQFEVTGAISEQTVAANQPVTLKVRFDGRGNAKLIDLPKLGLPSSIEVYDTKSESKFFKNGQSYKEFEVLLIPREAGSVTIPALSFSLFDPDSGQFYRKGTSDIQLTVTPSSGDQAIASAPRESKDEAKEIEKEARNGMPDLALGWEASGWGFPFQPLIFWPLVYLVIFIVLGFWTIMQFGIWRKGRDLRALYKQRILRVIKLADKGDWRSVGVEGTNLIYLVLGEISGSRGGYQELEKLVMKAPPSVRREVEAPLRKIMNTLEALGFAPEALTASLRGKKELKKTVSELDNLLSHTLDLALVSLQETASDKGKA